MDDSDGVKRAIRAMGDTYSESAITKETLQLLGQISAEACEHVSIRMDAAMFYASVEGFCWFFPDRVNETEVLIPVDARGQRQDAPWTTDDTLMGRQVNLKTQKVKYCGAWVMFVCVPDADDPKPRPVPVQADFCPKCGRKLPLMIRVSRGNATDGVQKLMDALGWRNEDATANT